MMTHYYKRDWNETTGEPLTNDWGVSTYYFETDEEGEVLRQVQIFSNGQSLKYDTSKLQDEYGGLSEVALDLNEFEEFKIEQQEFEEVWD